MVFASGSGIKVGNLTVEQIEKSYNALRKIARVLNHEDLVLQQTYRLNHPTIQAVQEWLLAKSRTIITREAIIENLEAGIIAARKKAEDEEIVNKIRQYQKLRADDVWNSYTYMARTSSYYNWSTDW